MRKKTWKRVATIALAVVFAVSLITTAEIVSGVGSVSVQAQEYYVDEYTDRLFDGTWRVKKDVTINSSILVWAGSRVLLIIDDGVTLTVKGEDGDGRIPGNAAIELERSSTLTIAGGGTLNAIGGNGGDGKPGADASESSISDYAYVGAGGDNYKYTFNGKSQGGGGAGAGIGTNGGWGGLYGGGGGGNYKVDLGVKDNTYGSKGGAGQSGSAAMTGGTVIITGSVTVNAQGGKAGAGGKGGKRGKYAEKRFTWNAVAPGTSGGGGGGGGGGAADGIGCGGSGGGAGGGGASANVDGEAGGYFSDLDDLWGHGGGGGGSWGGNPASGATRALPTAVTIPVHPGSMRRAAGLAAQVRLARR